MRKVLILSTAIAATLALSACNKKEEAAEPAATEAAPAAEPAAAAPAAEAPKDGAMKEDAAMKDGDKAGPAMKGDEHTGGDKVAPADKK